MTSMPASRNARAMIFAPRSCPSRPGFAMTTLIFPATAPSLEDRRFAPDAPDVAERVAHLAHRDVGARRGEDRLHQVAPLVGGIVFEARERLLGGRRVAAGAERLDALDLLLLERGVDLEDLERLLVLELIAVDADDHSLLRFDLRLVAERRLGDLALLEVVLDRRDHAAELLDPVEVLVGLPLQFVRQL